MNEIDPRRVARILRGQIEHGTAAASQHQRYISWLIWRYHSKPLFGRLDVTPFGAPPVRCIQVRHFHYLNAVQARSARVDVETVSGRKLREALEFGVPLLEQHLAEFEPLVQEHPEEHPEAVAVLASLRELLQQFRDVAQQQKVLDAEIAAENRIARRARHNSGALVGCRLTSTPAGRLRRLQHWVRAGLPGDPPGAA